MEYRESQCYAKTLCSYCESKESCGNVLNKFALNLSEAEAASFIHDIITLDFFQDLEGSMNSFMNEIPRVREHLQALLFVSHRRNLNGSVVDDSDEEDLQRSLRYFGINSILLLRIPYNSLYTLPLINRRSFMSSDNNIEEYDYKSRNDEYNSNYYNNDNFSDHHDGGCRCHHHLTLTSTPAPIGDGTNYFESELNDNNNNNDKGGYDSDEVYVGKNADGRLLRSSSSKSIVGAKRSRSAKEEEVDDDSFTYCNNSYNDKKHHKKSVDIMIFHSPPRKRIFAKRTAPSNSSDEEEEEEADNNTTTTATLVSNHRRRRIFDDDVDAEF